MLHPSRRVPRRSILLAAAALGAAACGTETGQGGGGGQAASNYPSRPISWIVPYEPGGGSDRQVRRLQPHLQDILGQQINVVYQPGGDGAIGWQELHSASPDGYTIGNVVSPNIILSAQLGGEAGFQATDFRYVAWTETSPITLAVAADSRFATLDDFIAEAKAQPGKVTVAGIGQVSELALAQISASSGIEVSYVSVTGGAGPIITDLRGGHVDAAIFAASHVLEHADSLKGLAISGTEPSPALPDVPTFEEQEVTDVTLASAWGVATPPDTPDAIVQTLNDALMETLKNDEVKTALEEHGLTPLTQTPEEADDWTAERVELVEQAQQLTAGG